MAGELTDQDCVDMVRLLKHLKKYSKSIPPVPRSEEGDVIRPPRMRRLLDEVQGLVEDELFD
jgi:hypothetical protein